MDFKFISSVTVNGHELGPFILVVWNLELQLVVWIFELQLVVWNYVVLHLSVLFIPQFWCKDCPIIIYLTSSEFAMFNRIWFKGIWKLITIQSQNFYFYTYKWTMKPDVTPILKYVIDSIHLTMLVNFFLQIRLRNLELEVKIQHPFQISIILIHSLDTGNSKFKIFKFSVLMG